MSTTTSRRSTSTGATGPSAVVRTGSANDGTFTVTVVAVDEQLNRTVSTTTVVVANSPPELLLSVLGADGGPPAVGQDATIAISVLDWAEADRPLTLTLTSSMPGISFSGPVSGDRALRFRPTTAGTFTVTATLTDPDGGTAGPPTSTAMPFTFTVAAAPSTPAAPANVTVAAPPCSTGVAIRAQAADFLGLVNAYRGTQGLSTPLAIDPALQAAAQAHLDDLIANAAVLAPWHRQLGSAVSGEGGGVSRECRREPDRRDTDRRQRTARLADVAPAPCQHVARVDGDGHRRRQLGVRTAVGAGVRRHHDLHRICSRRDADGAHSPTCIQRISRDRCAALARARPDRGRGHTGRRSGAGCACPAEPGGTDPRSPRRQSARLHDRPDDRRDRTTRCGSPTGRGPPGRRSPLASCCRAEATSSLNQMRRCRSVGSNRVRAARRCRSDR